MKRGNWFLTVAFICCLVVFLRALSGAGYDPEVDELDAWRKSLRSNHTLVSRWGIYAADTLEHQWARIKTIAAVETMSPRLWRCGEHPSASSPDAWCIGSLDHDMENAHRFGPLKDSDRVAVPLTHGDWQDISGRAQEMQGFRKDPSSQSARARKACNRHFCPS